MEEVKEEDIEKLKKKLRSYGKKDIRFNEPHFTQQLLLRQGDREEVINNILNPDKLFYFSKEKGKYGDIKYNLHFKISNTKTMIIPVIFLNNYKKSLYTLTYIMRYRLWREGKSRW